MSFFSCFNGCFGLSFLNLLSGVVVVYDKWYMMSRDITTCSGLWTIAVSFVASDFTIGICRSAQPLEIDVGVSCFQYAVD